MPRPIRLPALIASLVVLLAACEMSVDFRTDVRADGSGTFSVAIALDREFVEGLQSFETQGGDIAEGLDLSGLSTLGTFFDCLKAQGWAVARSQPEGGVSVTASKTFANPEGFGSALASLRCEDDAASGGIQLSNIKLDLDYATTKTFFRTKTAFTGTVDLRGSETLTAEQRKALESLRELAGDVFKLRVVAALPGGVDVRAGDGVASGGEVTWEPQLGSLLRLSAESSTLNVVAVLLIGIPSAMLLGLLAWYLAGRRRPPSPEADPFEGLSAPTTEGSPAT